MFRQISRLFTALIISAMLCSCAKNERENTELSETSTAEMNVTTSAETGSASVTAAEKHVTEPQKITAEYDLTYKITDGEVTILGYKGADEKVVIPNEILGCPVTQIRVSAFADSDITELTLPDTMTEFKGLKSLAKLKTLNLPKGLKGFGGNLLGIDSLENVNITDGENFTSKDGILYSRDGKTLVYYPQGRTGRFTVPEGVEAIESHAFRYSAIRSITLPETLKSIGSGAFSDSGITTLDIPASVTEIGGRILGGNKELCISAEESGDHTVNLDYYNVTYRNDSVLKQAFRAANKFEGDKIFIDLNFDKFPELIYELPGEGWNILTYDTKAEEWEENYFRYFWQSWLTGADLELYYDRENDMYFYTGCNLVYGFGNYTAYKYYVCKNGFNSVCFGEERMYYGDNGEIFFVDHAGGEFSYGRYNRDMPVGADRIDIAGNTFLETMDRALEKYEHIGTVDMHSLITKASESESGIAFSGEEFADEPVPNGLRKSAPDIAADEFCSYTNGEFANEEIFDYLSEKTDMTLFHIYERVKPADLSGIEKLQSVKELFIEGEVTDTKPITALQNVEILHISNQISDLSFISEMQNLKVLEIYNCVYESEDYFAPIYGCENIEYLLCANSNVNEGQLKALKENMPWVEIFLYNSNSG